MSASADKVQYILENTLQETVPLVRRGIFSQAQLQVMMLKRQKNQQSMLKRQYKLTDYLSAIEYQYELERLRRYKMEILAKQEEGVNPLYKKQSTSDFAIVKRIIRLWDRTMHKYKFQPHLWKQYLSFTIAIQSKKHFYKTLTNALRFLPFDVQLWKIGAAYELEKGQNLWKGRKILIKGLKMVPAGHRNVQLSEFMLEYELHFLNNLLHRQSILIKGEEGMKMIGKQEEQSDKEEKEAIYSVKLTQYNKVMWIIIEQTFIKNCSDKHKGLSFHQIKDKLLKKIKSLLKKQEKQEVRSVISKLVNQLQGLNETNKQQNIQILEQQLEQEKNIVKEQIKQKSKVNNKDLNEWRQRLIGNSNGLNIQQAKLALKTFCLQPTNLSQIINFMLQVDESQAINILSSSKSKIPIASLEKLLDILSETKYEELPALIGLQVDRWIQPQEFYKHRNVIPKISNFNIQQDRLTSNIKIMRVLSIHYKHDPEFLQFCNCAFS